MKETLVATMIAAVILALSLDLASCIDNDPYEEKPSYSCTENAPQEVVWIISAIEAEHYYCVYKKDGSAVYGKYIKVSRGGLFLYKYSDREEGEFIWFEDIDDITGE